MSLNLKENGALRRIAGSTVILDATTSEIREGTFSIQCQGNSGANLSITFETPMPDTDYVVIFESDPPAAGEIGFRSKTTTGFNLYVLGCREDTATYTFTGKYYAFRLVELEGYTALQNKVSNPDSTPVENSTNLVTSGGVYDAIKNASSVFIGTSSEWESETSKTDYQVAILTDQPNVNAVDSTDGSTTVVGEPNKHWIGTKSEWDLLSTTEKARYEIVNITDDTNTNGKFIDITSQCTIVLGTAKVMKCGQIVVINGYVPKQSTNNIVNTITDLPSAISNGTSNIMTSGTGVTETTYTAPSRAYVEDTVAKTYGSSGYGVNYSIIYLTDE